MVGAVYEGNNLLGFLGLLFAVSQVRQLAEVMGIMKTMFAVQTAVFVLHNNVSGINGKLVFVRVLHRQLNFLYLDCGCGTDRKNEQEIEPQTCRWLQ
jgi:hypothetical protein